MLRSWHLRLQLQPSAQTALYLQIAQHIIEEIQFGRLPPHTVMPGTRELANSLHVNRKTVVLSYDELIAQGWLVTQRRRGTFVAGKPPTQALRQTAATPQALASHDSTRHDPPSSSEALLHFTEGVPDPRMMPYESIARSLRKALILQTRGHHHEAAAAQGLPELRAAIATMLNLEKGMHIGAEHICLVRNVQMGLFIAARTAMGKGSAVFETLSLPQARLALQGCGFELRHIGMGIDGMRLDELESLCRQAPPAMLFTTPLNQFPTTTRLSAAQRTRLLAMARRYGIRVLEYDHDHEFHFSEPMPFPLASEDSGGDVMYVANLSQALGHGVSVAYIVATPALASRCADEVELMDRKGNSEIEASIASLMESGELVRNIRKMRKTYAQRRALLYALVQDRLADWADMRLPERGLAFWLELRPEIDMQALAQAALAQRVGYTAGAAFTQSGTPVPAIRLGFASLGERELQAGVLRLRQALRQALR